MKALEILKHFKGMELTHEDTLFSIKYYDEAIKELEELKNRSCGNCKKFEQWYCSTGIMDVGTCSDKENILNIFDDNIENEIPYSFYCNKWENKE